MDIYQCVPQYILILFSECNTMTLDYIMFVSSVAAGANGIVTFTQIFSRMFEMNNKRARDVFLTHVLNIISMLDRENASCAEELDKIHNKNIDEAESDELMGAAKAKKKVTVNQEMIQKARGLYQAAYPQKHEAGEGQFFNCLSFIFTFLSIVTLVFSPQILSYKIHNAWLILLFLPQILALFVLIYLLIQKIFPLKYIIQVFSVRKNLFHKIWDVICFERDIFRYRPSNNRRVTNEIKLELSVSSDKK